MSEIGIESAYRTSVQDENVHLRVLLRRRDRVIAALLRRAGIEAGIVWEGGVPRCGGCGAHADVAVLRTFEPATWWGRARRLRCRCGQCGREWFELTHEDAMQVRHLEA